MAAEINAHIREIDSPYFYPVRLTWIPRIGELVHVAASTGHKPSDGYEVVAVVHQVSDETEEGWHFVSVWVKPTESRFLPPHN